MDKEYLIGKIKNSVYSWTMWWKPCIQIDDVVRIINDLYRIEQIKISEDELRSIEKEQDIHISKIRYLLRSKWLYKE